MNRTSSLFLACTIMFAAASCDDLAEDADCANICEKLRDCSGTYLGVQDCTDECFDVTDKGDSLHDDAEDCSDCLEDYSCFDVGDRCGICNDVLSTFTSYRFATPD